MEQHITFEDKNDVLERGKQEVLSATMHKLQGKMEMLYLIIIRRQDGIQKESSRLCCKASIHNLVIFKKCIFFKAKL